MTGKDLVLLISTFLMGMIAGGYLYVSAFAPSVESLLPDKDVRSSSFVIEGEMYGACEEDDSCASFQLIDGRDYHYISSPKDAVNQGRLDAAYRRVLLHALPVDVLEQNSKRSAQANCASSRGSIDYSYVITKDNEEYILDTCSTLLYSDQELQNLLSDLWFAFENPDAKPAEIPAPEIEFNIIDFFFDRFNNPED